jgi:hypothetical protein
MPVCIEKDTGHALESRYNLLEFLAWRNAGRGTGVKDFKNPHRTHEFSWGIGEVVTALLEAGLTLLALREYPYANGCRQFHGMREIEGNRMIPPEKIPSAIPGELFGLQACAHRIDMR